MILLFLFAASLEFAAQRFLVRIFAWSIRYYFLRHIFRWLHRILLYQVLVICFRARLLILLLAGAFDLFHAHLNIDDRVLLHVIAIILGQGDIRIACSLV